MTPGLLDHLRAHERRLRRARLLLLPLLDDLPRPAGRAPQEHPGADRGGRRRRAPARLQAVLPPAGRVRLQLGRGEGPAAAHDGRYGPARRGGRRRHRGRAGRHAGGDPQAARPAGRLHRLRRAHRAGEGLRAPVRRVRALRAAARAAPQPRAGGKAGAAGAAARQHHAPGRPVGRGEAVRHRGGPAAGPSERVREPVHGAARGLEDGAARAREREVRGDARAGAARGRRALLRRLRGVRGDADLAARASRRGGRDGAQRAARTSSATTPGTWSWRSTSGCWPRSPADVHISASSSSATGSRWRAAPSCTAAGSPTGWPATTRSRS